MVDYDRTAVTYRYECWRALPSGVIEAAGTIFLLLIAVRGYQAGPFAKAMVAGGGSVGLILAPLVVSERGQTGDWNPDCTYPTSGTEMCYRCESTV
jgi:hypothetical protein